MNREIKFRAWCTNSENISYSNGDHMEYDIVLVNGKYASVESGWDIHGTYDFPVMQYTGLKDKNGNEIYEGDIVKSEYNSLFIVVWVKFGASFRLSNIKNKLKEIDSESILNYDYLEVIGNIYENPELYQLT